MILSRYTPLPSGSGYFLIIFLYKHSLVRCFFNGLKKKPRKEYIMALYIETARESLKDGMSFENLVDILTELLESRVKACRIANIALKEVRI